MKMRQPPFFPLLAASAMLAALVGCGDDGNGPLPATPTATQPAATVTPAPTAPPTSLPVSSDLAAAENGGGCYPTALVLDSPLDMLTLIDPEWAPVVNGTLVDSEPVLLHGTVVGSHGDQGGDFSSTHARSDQNTFVHLDDADAGRYGTGNPDEIAFEWEVGAYPDWAWASGGDRIVGLGRWIFDCGHPDSRAGHCSITTDRGCVLNSECSVGKCPECAPAETCVGAHFGYSTELHPPYATAVMRFGRGGLLDAGTSAVPVTRTDIFISSYAGGAGDRCVVQHLANPLQALNTECYPLGQPHAVSHLNERDFEFDVPLPPKPPGGRATWHAEERPAPGGVAAAVDVAAHEDDTPPHLSVSVRLTQATVAGVPTGYAGTLLAGWSNDATPLTHVRVSVEAVAIHNPLQRARPVVPRVCSGSHADCQTAADCPSGQVCSGVGPVKRWRLQASVNGEWQELSGLESVSAGDVIPQTVVFDQYLPAEGQVQIHADGAAEDCINAVMGRSLKQDLSEIGFGDGLNCILSSPHETGNVDVTYAAPTFGASDTVYETRSAGGEGGNCSTTTDQLCVVDADCPSGELCTRTGGSFSLRYRIESVGS